MDCSVLEPIFEWWSKLDAPKMLSISKFYIPLYFESNESMRQPDFHNDGGKRSSTASSRLQHNF